MPQLAFIGQSARARSMNASNLRLLNGYVEATETKQGKVAVTVYGAPGTTLFTTIPGAGGIRALYTSRSDGRVFAVRGAGVWEVFADTTSRFLGSMHTTTGPVSVDDSGLHVVFVDGPDGWALDLAANTFLQFTDPSWEGADRVAFLDAYFIFNKPGTQMFYLFGRGATVFDALDFASAEGAPDKLVSLLVNHRELWLFGATTTEVWFNSGGPFPFSRIQGAFVETGCGAPASPAKMAEQVFWLAQDERGAALVVKAQGYLPERISTHALEFAMAQYTKLGTISDAIGYTYQQEGHHFYVLTFPTANATWAYDLSTQLWAERGWMDPDTAAVGRHRSNAHTFGFGKHLVGDFADGRIYALDLDTSTDDGQAQPLEMILPPIFDSNRLNMVAYQRFLLDVEAGVGNSTPPGEDPHLMLQWSDDGGHTWGTEQWLPLGKIGEYARRAECWQLGATRDRRFKVRITDAVKRAVLGCYVDYEVLGA